MNDRARSLAIVYDVAYPFVDGGGERRLYEIARRLVHEGWNVDWYCLKTWDGEQTRIVDGIRYVGLSGFAKLYRPDGSRSRRAALSFGRAVLFAKVRFSKYDVVWCGQWPYFHVLALCARLVPWRTNLVMDWWEVWGREEWLTHGLAGVGGWALEFTIAKIASRLGRVVTISSLGFDQLVKLGARKAGVELIPNGVNVGSIVDIPPADGVSDLTYFGRLKDHKNVDHLVTAVDILRKRGTTLKVDIIGDGPERGALEALAHSLGVADQIAFHGRLDDRSLLALLKRNRVFVHPSTKEGGGSITLLEANACGLPVVCYRHPRGVDPALVQDRRTGLLVGQIGADSLADGIMEMITLTETRSLREECVAFAQGFDWSAIAGRYRDFFSSLLKSDGFAVSRPTAQPTEQRDHAARAFPDTQA